MAHFEIEIKSLLGEKAKADELVEKMRSLDPNFKKTAHNSQLNHYFTGGDLHKLYEKVEHLFVGEQHDKFKKIADKGSDFSVRSRQKNDEVLLVVKASIDGGTSSNTVSRMEFEEPVAVTLDELDQLVLEAGFAYEAKWSRDRNEYEYKDVSVCIDCNAGYGYLAEFETVTEDEDSLDKVKGNLEAIMVELGVEELSQDRLARMFAFYNKNWPDYYGTDKTFTVE
ncbi:MAG: CYTH domain-containing protein [Candidatus Paceibacterota bacterium]